MLLRGNVLFTQESGIFIENKRVVNAEPQGPQLKKGEVFELIAWEGAG